MLPSLAEGFGLPVLEAMVRGTPSPARGSPLREVAGDAALYFDPLDVGSIASALERRVGDEQLGAPQRRRPGAAKLFSWERAAEETYAGYERALR